MKRCFPILNVEGFKPSQYNIFIEYDDGTICAFNSLYKSCVLFDSNESIQLLTGRYTKDIIDALISMRFIILFKFDEWEYYKFQYLSQQYSTDLLSLSIMPTLSCNLSCPYCYEKRNNSFMSDKTQSALVEWISQMLVGRKRLHIDWFGGEPLLDPNIICNLSKEILLLCNNAGIQFSASATTNGTKLTPDVIEILDSCNVSSLQVTFDGNSIEHDRQKHFIDGSGSFDCLVHNVTNYCQSRTNANSHGLRIRINVSDSNYDTIEKLLKSLPVIVKNNSSVFFRWLYPTHNRDYSSQKQGNDPHIGLYQLQKLALNLGFNVDDSYENMHFTHCEADNPGFFTIDPLGNIYTCVHEYSPQYSIGHVSQGLESFDVCEFYKFRNTTVFDDQECRNCLVLPLCHGGCRRARMIGRKQCIFEKKSPELYVDMVCSKLKKY